MRFLVASLIASSVAFTTPACQVHVPETSPASPMETRYRLQARGLGERAAVATRVYRGLLSQSLFSQCAMVPHDSAMFDLRVHRCGVVRAALVSISRLFLERAATPQYLRPVRLGGRLRWLDLPGTSPCD